MGLSKRTGALLATGILVMVFFGVRLLVKHESGAYEKRLNSVSSRLDSLSSHLGATRDEIGIMQQNIDSSRRILDKLDAEVSSLDSLYRLRHADALSRIRQLKARLEEEKAELRALQKNLKSID